MKNGRLLLLLLLVIFSVGLAFSFWLRDQIGNQEAPYLYQAAGQLPENQVGLVLGAQVVANKIPSQALLDRLQTARELLRSGKVSRLLLSGDGRTADYDEVEVMRQYLLQNQVPSADLILDKEGLRTYTSCQRAKDVYHLDRLTVITQRDHLVRALYLCRELGIAAVGITAPDYITANRITPQYLEYVLRERAALLLAWIEINLHLTLLPSLS